MATRALFVDEVHISNSGGTVVLVSDIQHTLWDQSAPRTLHPARVDKDLL